jgi:hypothetical protein
LIWYLTFNDAPSGIYSSQVIDVIHFLRKELKADIRLIAFISLRNFSDNRKKIKADLKDAVVLPMVPGIQRWRANRLTLKLFFLFTKAEMVMARSVLAAQLALECGIKKMAYDGRGAIEAEWKEYKVIEDAEMLKGIHRWEEEAVLRSSYRIAVSEQLVEFWRKEFGYNSNEHAVIPCTLNALFEKISLNKEQVNLKRGELGINEKDILFAYSGSVAGWQSFALLYDFLAPQLKSSISNKVLFLSDKDENISRLEKEFPQQIICKKVKPHEVPAILIAADYGLLIREKSKTNRVASPVKFAEYLACGLKVIISEKLGDYTDLVKKKNRGYVFSPGSDIKPVPVPFEEKTRLSREGISMFSKKNYIEAYRKVLTA